MRRFLLCLLSLILICVYANAETVDLSFTNIGSNGWTNSYGAHTYSTDDYTVSFKACSKQTGTITDVPVTKGGTVVITLKNDRYFATVKFTLKKWGTKTKTAILKYSTDGTNFSAFTPAVSSSTFTVEANSIPDNVIAIELSFTETSNQVGVESIEYTVSGGTTLTPAELSFPEPEYTANIGEEFTAPKLSKATDAPAKYTSSNETVADVDAETGAVTIKAVGTTTITATVEATDTYTAGTASYKLTVVDPNSNTVDLSFTNLNISPAWSNSYINSYTYDTNDYTVAFKDFAKQTSTITAYPVTKEGTVVITLKNNKCFATVKFNLIQWGSKAKTAVLKYSTDGETFSAFTPAVSSSDFTVEANSIPDGVIAIELSFSGNASNQVGVESIEYTVRPEGDPSKENVTLSFPQAEYSAIYPGEFTAPELTKSAEVEITYSSSNEAVATVDAKTGAVTLKGAGTTTIKVVSEETEVYNSGSAFYTIVVELGANTINEIIAAGQNVDILVNFPMTVTYINGRYIYVYDGESYGLVYDDKAVVPSYAEGAVIPAGWKVNYVNFNGLPEIQPVGAMPESTETTEAPAVETVVSISDEMLNQIVVLQGVEFKSATQSATNNFTGTANGTEYTFRNTFAISSVAAGTYNVKLAVSYYKTDVQLVPIEYVKVETYTVYLNNAAGWDEVYVYTWQTTEDGGDLYPCGAWPGTKLEANADGLYEFSITAETEPVFSGIIFNNGGNGEQTPDLTYVAGKTYTNETAISFVYFDNKAYWADVHVYAWNKTSGKNNANWPGEAAQKCKIGDNDYYYFAAPAGTYDMIIFNGSGAQTTDLSLIDGTIYSTDNQGENATSQEKMNDLGQVSLELPFTSEKTEEDLIVTFQVPASFHIYYTFTPTTETVPENAPARAKAGFVAAENNVVTLPKDVTGKLDYYAEVNNTETAPSTYNIDASGEITGVDNIAISAEQTPVYYYNMQGVRIANPANGMYIRIEGNKVSKVIVK